MMERRSRSCNCSASDFQAPMGVVSRSHGPSSEGQHQLHGRAGNPAPLKCSKPKTWDRRWGCRSLGTVRADPEARRGLVQGAPTRRLRLGRSRVLPRGAGPAVHRRRPRACRRGCRPWVAKFCDQAMLGNTQRNRQRSVLSATRISFPLKNPVAAHGACRRCPINSHLRWQFNSPGPRPPNATTAGTNTLGIVTQV